MTLSRIAAGLLLGALVAPAVAEAPRHWSRGDLAALVDVLRSAGSEGLEPADYGLAALDRAISDGDSGVDATADASALALAHDYFEGRRDLRARPEWHFTRQPVDYSAWLDQILAGHSVTSSFAHLLPQGNGYAGLRVALARCGDRKDCATIRVNLDRWRALPRSFEPRYLWVNVAAQRVDLIDHGHIISSHRIVVGKPGTKTPLFRAEVTAITANPWWNVPCSIVDESVGELVRKRPAEAARKGFVARTDAKGQLVVRQKPGLDNALGRIKFEMPNPYGVYLHDTPSRHLFERESRALSHGCIRTEKPDELARVLLGKVGARALDGALLTFDTKTIALPSRVPVYVVYLTAEADTAAPDGVAHHADIYQRDAAERP